MSDAHSSEIYDDEFITEIIAHQPMNELFTEATDNTPQGSTIDIQQNGELTKNNHEETTTEFINKSAFRRFIEFHAARQLTTAEWLAGVAGGEALVDGLGANRWLAATVVGTVIAPIDYSQTHFFRDAHDHEAIQNPKSKSAVRKEAASLASAAWQGAGPTTIVDRSLGIESTKRRQKIHAAIYAGCIALWTTPIPPFRQLGNGTQSALSYAIDNPVESLTTGGVVSLSVFGALEAIKKYRNSKNDNVT